MNRTELYSRSIQTIHANQHVSGAYVACPSYPAYQYSWLRDGSFIAHAMDMAGEQQSAKRFHRWMGDVVLRHTPKIDTLIARKRAGDDIAHADQMHPRFTVEGTEVGDSDWGNFQLDGYGTWLWSLVEHVQHTSDSGFYEELRPQVESVVGYLETFWQSPCFDCWEEHSDRVHVATLSALYGGLRALATYDPTLDVTPTLSAIRTFVLERGVTDGHLTKFIGDASVDASLLGAGVPYGLLPVDDMRMQYTIEEIEKQLGTPGVHRYLGDTYYGGGAWLLLSAWLGWYYAKSGQLVKAEAQLEWIIAQAAEDGALPEQVNNNMFAPHEEQQWIDRLGTCASPLLWSHAMYILLDVALRDTQR